jgi:hypothetical protein
VQWAIEYYETTDGRCPVREFVDGLSPEGQAKYIFITRLLTEYGVLVREPYVKQLTARSCLRYGSRTRQESVGYSTSHMPKEISAPAWLYEEGGQDPAEGD